MITQLREYCETMVAAINKHVGLEAVAAEHILECACMFVCMVFPLGAILMSVWLLAYPSICLFVRVSISLSIY